MDNVTWVRNSTVTYKIRNVRPQFYYYDAKQKVEIPGNDMIVIDGGRLDVIMPFDFTIERSGGIPTSGSGEAFAISDEVMFAKSIDVEKGYVVYHLVDWNNNTFDEHRINITRHEPANLSK